ncbi:hypothetical protein [Methylobacterium sp. ID0610]|uniref:hypothetical protein n=1 Tax=Methylobacterium carpenticola TaxID=3344827 RepID=UPI0036C61217
MQRMPKSRAQIEAIILSEARSLPGGECIASFHFGRPKDENKISCFYLHFNGGSEAIREALLGIVTEMVVKMTLIYDMKSFTLH